jgi:3-phenylpropionate/trans-cinnamate dioxygenase ferredoxin subunit
MALVRICQLDEVSPGQAVKIVVEGLPIALVKDSAGTVHAIGDTCTHGEISLSEGFVENDTLECWAHGSKFELATGKPQNFPAFDPVPVYAVTVVDGEIFIDPTVTLEIS